MRESNLPAPREVAKSAVWYTAATFLTKALGFITIPIFARLMSQEDFGTFNAFASIQILLVGVLGFEAHRTVNRARFDFQDRQLKEYQLSLLVLIVATVSIFSIPLFIWPEFFETITTIDQQYLVIMMVYAAFYPAFTMFQEYQRVQYRYKLSAAVAFMTSLIATAISVVLVVGLADALMGRIAGYYLPFAAAGCVFFGFYVLSGRRIRLMYLRYAIPLCLPLIVATIGTQGLLVGNRIVVQFLGSPEETALVALATTVANIAVILFTTLNQAWAPWLMDCLQNHKFEMIGRTFIPVLSFITMTVAACSLLAPELMAILGGPDYAPAAGLVPSFMASALLGMIAGQYILVQIFHKSVLRGSIATLLAAAANTVLCIGGVLTVGFESVGYVSIVCYLALIVAHKFINRSLPSPDVFPWRTLLPAIFTALAIIPAALFLMDSSVDWLRYVLAALTTCVGVLVLRRARRQRRSSALNV